VCYIQSTTKTAAEAKKAAKKLQEQAKLAAAKSRAEKMFSALPVTSSTTKSPAAATAKQDSEKWADSFSDSSDEESGGANQSTLWQQMQQQQKLIESLKHQIKLKGNLPAIAIRIVQRISYNNYLETYIKRKSSPQTAGPRIHHPTEQVQAVTATKEMDFDALFDNVWYLFGFHTCMFSSLL